MPEPAAPPVITPAMRDGVLHAIGRLNYLAVCYPAKSPQASALRQAARALREELKIAEGA